MPDTTPVMPPRSRLRGPDWLRLAVFLLLASYILVGPAFRQVHNTRNIYLPQWVMFTGFGLDVCDVRYAQILSDGTEQEVDRYEVLGYPSRREAPRNVWRIGNEKQAVDLGRRLCRKLGPDTDLRLHARCARRSGWRHEARGQDNLCAKTSKKP